MEYVIDYLDDKNIVCVKIKGKLNFRISKRYSIEALKVAHRNNCTKFLFDHSKTTVEGGIKKFYVAAEELQQYGFHNSDRIAIMVVNIDEGSQLIKHEKQNSRLSVLKYFPENKIQEAYSWLLDIE
jgi:hypothetical protein